MTDPELLHSFLHWAEHDKGLRPLTIRAYTHTLNQWLTWLDGKPLADVLPEDVEAFARRPRRHYGTNKGKVGSNATRRKDIVAVRMLHQWGHSRGYLPRDGAATSVTPKTPPRMPKPIPDEMWRELWLSDLPPDDRLWLGLGYYAGLRRFEIVTIPPSGVDAKSGTLTFERKGGSTHPVEYRDVCRVLESNLPWIAEGWRQWDRLVGDHAKAREGERFLIASSVGDPSLDGTRLNKRLCVLLGHAGLERDAFTPHALRHSFATNLLRCGVEIAVVANLMSHSTPAITMSYVKTSGQLRRWFQERDRNEMAERRPRRSDNG
jgi:integrase/recombinase XerD